MVALATRLRVVATSLVQSAEASQSSDLLKAAQVVMAEATIAWSFDQEMFNLKTPIADALVTVGQAARRQKLQGAIDQLANEGNEALPTDAVE